MSPLVHRHTKIIDVISAILKPGYPGLRILKPQFANCECYIQVGSQNTVVYVTDEHGEFTITLNCSRINGERHIKITKNCSSDAANNSYAYNHVCSLLVDAAADLEQQICVGLVATYLNAIDAASLAK